MEVFSLIVASVLVVGLVAFILITLFTIVRDLMRRSKNRNSKPKEVENKRKEEN